MSLSQLFPIAEYAEDQQFPRLILYSHVVHRMINVSAGIAVISTGVRLAYRKYRPPTEPIKCAILQQSFTKSLLNASYRSILIGPVLGVIATTFVMRNKTLIEWQDRSWRLLANNGQNLTDKWSIGGIIIGAIGGSVASRKFKISLPKAVAGSASLGCLAGLTCMVIYGKIAA